MKPALRTRRTVLGQVLEHSRRHATRECCGLLAGRDGVVTHAFPAENVASEPAKSYEIAPKEIIRLMREFRERRLGFLGIYHSHPNGENEPSSRDIELAYYSEAIYLIVSPRPYREKPIRAFSIRDRRVSELTIEVL